MRGWVAIVAAAGCAGDKTQSDDIVPLDDDDDDTFVPPVDTGLDGGSIDAAAFAVIARFAYDPALGNHVSYAPPDEGLAPMSLTVVLLDSDALYGGAVDETTSCAVTLELPGPAPRAAWADVHGAWTAFDLAEAGAVTVRDQCRFYGLPAEFDRDAGGHVAKWSWGVGIGELDPLVGEFVRQTSTPSAWAALEPVLVGGMLRSDLFIGLGTTTAGDGVSDQGIAVGYEVDGNFEIEAGGIGDFQAIPKETVPLEDGGVARGYYEVQYGPVGPADVLTREPGGSY